MLVPEATKINIRALHAEDVCGWPWRTCMALPKRYEKRDNYLFVNEGLVFGSG
jgi:hypothetical protein